MQTEVEKETAEKMETYRRKHEGTDPNYAQNASEEFTDIQMKVKKAKQKFIEKLLPICDPNNGDEFWDALQQMDVEHHGKLNIEKINQLSLSKVSGQEKAKWIRIWLLPELERTAAGFPSSVDLAGSKGLDFFLAKSTFLFQVLRSFTVCHYGLLNSSIAQAVIY